MQGKRQEKKFIKILDRSTERITFPLNDFAASLKLGRNFEDSFATASSII
jgi:hypothetical protein